jgi:hypothetical protein
VQDLTMQDASSQSKLYFILNKLIHTNFNIIDILTKKCTLEEVITAHESENTQYATSDEILSTQEAINIVSTEFRLPEFQDTTSGM